MSTKVENSPVSSIQSLQNKTPVTNLQELCTKRGIKPSYELKIHEGRVHDPIFVYEVVAGEVTAEGRGSSKKKAKHNAAESLLKKLLPSAVDQKPFANGKSGSLNSLEEDSDDIQSVNCVGELQELSQQNRWPLPCYEWTGERGLAHDREFTCTVRLANLTETGNGKSKKQAKRNAAENLLRLFKNNSDIDSQISSLHGSSTSDDVIADRAYEEIRNTVISLKTELRVPTLTPKDSLELSQFYQGLKYRMGKTLASLQVLSLNVPATNYCQMLQEIAEEQNFEAVYADIPHLSASGQFQCLVQLSSMPVAVCQGVGHSKDEARSTAAHNALQYLKIMTRK